MPPSVIHFIFGKLTWDALPHVWYTVGGTASLFAILIAAAGFVTYKKRWTWLWKEWLTSTDPKRIGIMYIIIASLMLFRGALDALMIWAQQATAATTASAASGGYLDPSHFQQIFTAHGDIMVFFVTMGFLFGLINLIVPLQIGARDLAFPFLNSLGFWLYLAGAALINMFFVVGGDFAAAGWLAAAPLAELKFSPGVGMDYWIWSLQISGIGTLIGGINFVVTIIKMRAPGMTLMRMPFFTWTSLCSMILVISIFPVLTVTIGLLSLDRMLGMHFFTADFGGNMMMYTNMIWIWGHPEVYVLVLPTFGVWSEVIATFTGKRIASYRSLVLAAIGITMLSFVVWLHHFFTMGSGADVNAFFGIMTMLIAIPTAVQIYIWLRTMYRSHIRFITPMYWFLGFVSTFTFGGLAGVLLASPAADFQLHNSLFLVAHFHTMVIGGALYGIFAGIVFWWPKVMGFRLDERLGKIAFWWWVIGFLTAFVPLYILGFMGAARRMDHYSAALGYQPLFIVAAAGVCIIGVGALIQVWQVIYSVKHRDELADTTGDPWNARTLEWSTPSPAPFYNFAVTPIVHGHDPWMEMKEEARGRGLKDVHSHEYQDILMSKNTGIGIYLAACAFIFGFAMVWHIWWMAGIGLAGAIACIIVRGFQEETEYVIQAAEVERLDKAAWAEMATRGMHASGGSEKEVEMAASAG